MFLFRIEQFCETNLLSLYLRQTNRRNNLPSSFGGHLHHHLGRNEGARREKKRTMTSVITLFTHEIDALKERHTRVNLVYFAPRKRLRQGSPKATTVEA